MHLNEKAQKYRTAGFTQALGIYTEDPLNFLSQRLDESREMRILTDGLGVDQAFRGITVGSKKVLPSVRSSEGQK